MIIGLMSDIHDRLGAIEAVNHVVILAVTEQLRYLAWIRQVTRWWNCNRRIYVTANA